MVEVTLATVGRTDMRGHACSWRHALGSCFDHQVGGDSGLNSGGDVEFLE